MSVPLLDLKCQYAALKDEILPAMHAVCDSQYFIGGPQVAAFETAMASYCGTAHRSVLGWRKQYLIISIGLILTSRVQTFLRLDGVAFYSLRRTCNF